MFWGHFSRRTISKTGLTNGCLSRADHEFITSYYFPGVVYQITCTEFKNVPHTHFENRSVSLN